MDFPDCAWHFCIVEKSPRNQWRCGRSDRAGIDSYSCIENFGGRRRCGARYAIERWCQRLLRPQTPTRRRCRATTAATPSLHHMLASLSQTILRHAASQHSYHIDTSPASPTTVSVKRTRGEIDSGRQSQRHCAVPSSSSADSPASTPSDGVVGLAMGRHTSGITASQHHGTFRTPGALAMD